MKTITIEGIENWIKSAFEEQTGLDPDRIQPETNLAELGFDSLDVVDLVMAAEDEFAISIDKAELPALKTLADAVAALAKKIGVDDMAKDQEKSAGVARGKVMAIGDDETGQPRIVIHATREELMAGPNLACRVVVVGAAEYALQQAELVSLLAFAGEILRRHRGDDPHDIGDVGGGAIQDAAVKFGLLESRTVTEACGAVCVCAEVGDFPRECYFYSPLANRAVPKP